MVATTVEEDQLRGMWKKTKMQEKKMKVHVFVDSPPHGEDV
jgi:hypothetical protein